MAHMIWHKHICLFTCCTNFDLDIWVGSNLRSCIDELIFCFKEASCTF